MKKKVPETVKTVSGTRIKSLLQYCYLLKIAIVSEAIISSSSVGITTTFTLESSVEITASSPRTLFFSKSTLTPINPRPSHTSLRQLHWFSPTPPVNTMISTPPKAAATHRRYECLDSGGRWNLLFAVAAFIFFFVLRTKEKKNTSKNIL